MLTKLAFTKLAFLVLAGTLGRAWAADPPAEEYHVKGAFLLNFAKFVDWPGPVFKGPADPITICVLGANPFGPGLEVAAHGLVVGSRPVSVRQISDAQLACECQIVFVAVTERKRSHVLLEAVKACSVLTVGESEGFLGDGGVIDFRVDESRVHIEISTAAAARAGLHISAKLLSLAQAGRK